MGFFIAVDYLRDAPPDARSDPPRALPLRFLGLENVAAGLEELSLHLWFGAPRAGTISERRYREAGQIQAKFGWLLPCADPGP